MTRIFDNITAPLGPHLRATLSDFGRMDVAVGYFNLRGWSMFDEIVATKTPATGRPVVRILIGMLVATDAETTLDGLQRDVEDTAAVDADANIARERKAELVEHLRTQLMRGMPTPGDRATLAALRTRLADGAVQIKVFTRRALHGKAYIFHRVDLNNPITAFVGSSNLTAAGLMSNYELNVDVVDSAAAADLDAWFTDRWDDPFSRPVTDDILSLLEDSWAAPAPRPPHEVFLKVCYDLSRDVREGLAEYSVPPEISGQLLDFQTTAVRTIARRLMTRRGTMLGDVVGLGKTLVAIAVALMLRDEHGYQPLVVCPKNLEAMWNAHMVAYGLHGKVVPYSMAHTVLPDERRYPLVIVDESHTLRNADRRDYRALAAYIRANESRTLLLTATPFNIRFTDVANQLALFLEPDDDLGIAPAGALASDPGIFDKVDGKITTLAAFALSEDPEDWQRLMSEHLVRRTRSFIRANHALHDEQGREYLSFPDGRRFTFPTRVPRPIAHPFAPGDPAAAMASETTLDTIRALALPRYDLGAYLAGDVTYTPAEREQADNLLRGRGQVAGFVRTTFYKRLSSCGYSFIVSLRRHVARNELVTYALDSGLPIPVGTVTDTNLDDDPTTEDDDQPTTADLGQAATARYAALVAAAPSGVTWLRPELFTPALRTDLLADTAALRGLLDTFGPPQVATDSKLAALRDLVTRTHPDEKVLIFTEYKDTAQYIAYALRSAGVDRVAAATGDSEDPTGLARRFSPRSNALPGQPVPAAPEDELRILVATDVLSEGQNLQDAHVVANYDLPWAIVRLIQRAGRVDRIGQGAPEVFAYSFFHESVDSVIALRARIADRLKANAKAFGSDERFFGTDDEVATLTGLYDPQVEDGLDDVDAASLAYQYWRNATDDDPALARRVAAMPDLVDATRARRVTDLTDGVACYVRTQAGLDGFALAAPGATPRLLTGHEALRVFEAGPDVPGLALRADHDGLVAGAVHGPLAATRTAALTAGRLRGVRRTVWHRLEQTLDGYDADTSEALDALYQHPLTDDAARRLRQAVRSGVSDTDLAARVTALHRDDTLVVARTGIDPIRIVASMGVAP